MTATTPNNVINLGEERNKAQGESLLQLALRRLRRDRLTIIALFLVFIITLSAIIAPIISQNILQRDYGRTDVVNAFVPPGGAERIFFGGFDTFRGGGVYLTAITGPADNTAEMTVDISSKQIEANQGKAMVFVAHGALDASRAVDVYLEGVEKPIAARLAYGKASALVPLEPGVYNISVFRSGQKPGTDDPLITRQGVTLEPEKLSVLVTLGTPAEQGDKAAAIDLFAESTAQVPANRFRVQFVNASYQIPAMDFLIDNAEVAKGVAYRSSTSATDDNDTHVVSATLPGARTYILGTDDLGRDQLARLLWGGQVSLSIGFLAALISILIGVTVGITTGYYGGLVDDGVNWVITTLNSLPTLLLLLIIVAIFRPTPVVLILVLGLLGWTGTVRLVRGETLSIRAREYVISARSIGVPTYRIMLVHILPNLLSIVLINLALDIGSLILTESALSFLGFGINPPTPSWGNMLTGAQTFFTKGPHLVVWPGLLISITVLCLYVIGDGLRDAFDPTLKN